MKFQWKVSGKRFVTDSRLASSQGQWRVESRPGGWLIAERITESGERERIRGHVSESQGKLSVQWLTPSGSQGPYFGDWSRVEAGRAGASAGVSPSDFTAQFPGKVRRLLVAEGDRVEENQKLLLVEAMKMEFAISAPVAGIVKRLRVSEGQQLSPGDLMLDFEVFKNA
jgi:biotin carboxyl carrier protein